jgi:hypothetical protein
VDDNTSRLSPEGCSDWATGSSEEHLAGADVVRLAQELAHLITGAYGRRRVDSSAAGCLQRTDQLRLEKLIASHLLPGAGSGRIAELVLNDAHECELSSVLAAEADCDVNGGMG